MNKCMIDVDDNNIGEQLANIIIDRMKFSNKWSIEDYPRLPKHPAQYRIIEWDGTVAIVWAVLWENNSIRIRYENEIVHEVSVPYFYEDLKATKYCPVVIDIEFVYNRHDATVMALMSDDTIVDLFNYYDDEISFSKFELMSLTVKQAEELRLKKDITYLRS